MATAIKPRNITVELDPIDAIQAVIVLKEIEATFRAMGNSHLRYVHSLRKAIDASLDERYPIPPLTETELRALHGDR